MALHSRREMMRQFVAFGSMPPLFLADSQPDQLPTYDESEAYFVYSTLISEHLIFAKAESLVIAALTVSSEMCLRPEGKSASILAPAIANYRELAAKQWQLTRHFNVSKSYTLMDQAGFDSYFSKEGSGWNGFYAHYPKSGGYLFLSSVGFNPAKDVAVVQVNHCCGSRCGDGRFFVLQKRDGQWKPMNWQGSFCTWKS